MTGSGPSSKELAELTGTEMVLRMNSAPRPSNRADEGGPQNGPTAVKGVPENGPRSVTAGGNFHVGP